MILFHDEANKILQIIKEDETIKKRDHYVIAKVIDNKLLVIPELSDATEEEIIDYNLTFSTIAQGNKIFSYICDIDFTSILCIEDSILKTCDENTIIALCRLGARNAEMQILEKVDKSATLCVADSDFQNEFRKNLERITPLEKIIDRIVRQYCHKFGSVNFTGYAERIFVQEILLKK